MGARMNCQLPKQDLHAYISDSIYRKIADILRNEGLSVHIVQKSTLLWQALRKKCTLDPSAPQQNRKYVFVKCSLKSVPIKTTRDSMPYCISHYNNRQQSCQNWEVIRILKEKPTIMQCSHAFYFEYLMTHSLSMIYSVYNHYAYGVLLCH